MLKRRPDLKVVFKQQLSLFVMALVQSALVSGYLSILFYNYQGGDASLTWMAVHGVVLSFIFWLQCRSWSMSLTQTADWWLIYSMPISYRYYLSQNFRRIGPALVCQLVAIPVGFFFFSSHLGLSLDSWGWVFLNLWLLYAVIFLRECHNGLSGIGFLDYLVFPLRVVLRLPSFISQELIVLFTITIGLSAFFIPADLNSYDTLLSTEIVAQNAAFILSPVSGIILIGAGSGKPVVLIAVSLLLFAGLLDAVFRILRVYLADQDLFSQAFPNAVLPENLTGEEALPEDEISEVSETLSDAHQMPATLAELEERCGSWENAGSAAIAFRASYTILIERHWKINPWIPFAFFQYLPVFLIFAGFMGLLGFLTWRQESFFWDFSFWQNLSFLGLITSIVVASIVFLFGSFKYLPTGQLVPLRISDFVLVYLRYVWWRMMLSLGSYFVMMLMLGVPTTALYFLPCVILLLLLIACAHFYDLIANALLRRDKLLLFACYFVLLLLSIIIAYNWLSTIPWNYLDWRYVAGAILLVELIGLGLIAAFFAIFQKRLGNCVPGIYTPSQLRD